MFARPGQTTAVPKLQYIVRVDGWNWMVGSGLYTDDVDALLQKALWSSLALVVVVFLGVGAIGLIVSRSVLRQIGGEPTEAIAIMQEVAEGNLDAQIPTSHPGSMLDGLAHMVTSLRKLVTEVRSATDSTATASGEIAQGNNDLAHRTEDTASNLQTTASSMEELTSTVKQTSDSAQTANQMATSAAAVAARGGRGGVPRGVHHAGHQRQQQQDQRHHRRDRRHRLPDQHPDAQRRRRGRPRRRTGARFCGGGQRGAQPGPAQRCSRQGDQGVD
jgi:methyl-accepting chemotaxis protein